MLELFWEASTAEACVYRPASEACWARAVREAEPSYSRRADALAGARLAEDSAAAEQVRCAVEAPVRCAAAADGSSPDEAGAGADSVPDDSSRDECLAEPSTVARCAPAALMDDSPQDGCTREVDCSAPGDSAAQQAAAHCAPVARRGGSCQDGCSERADSAQADSAVPPEADRCAPAAGMDDSPAVDDSPADSVVGDCRAGLAVACCSADLVLADCSAAPTEDDHSSRVAQTDD